MKARSLLDTLVDNWAAKVLSVAAAIVLFMFHRMSALEERYFSVPLAVRTDGDLVPASSYPRAVRITLRGEANSVFALQENDIEAYIDLARYKGEGVYKAPVLVRKKGAASGVDPLEVNVDPLEVAVAVEFKATKTVPVTPSFRGYLESGFELSSYAIEPSSVELSGPASVVQRIADITTDFIELSGRKEDFSARVKLLNRDPLVSLAGEGSVDFRGSIQQSVMIKTLDRLPIILTGLKPGLIALPQVNFGTVKFQGSQNDLEAYLPEASLLSLDCSEVDDEGTYMLPLVVSAPPNFTVVRFDPVEVAVEVSRQGEAPR